VNNVEDLDYSAQELRLNGHRTGARITSEYYNEKRGKGPFEYQIPEPLVISPERAPANVQLQVQRHEDTWKTGLLFYGVRLVPAP
jgi:hypothetical protein